MAFLNSSISNIFNKNMFSEESYSSILSENGPYTIKIKSNTEDTYFVEGLITEEMQFSMSPEWDNLGIGSVINNIPMIDKFKQLGNTAMYISGKSISNSGFLTEKYYVKSGYLDISPSFRVVNHNDDGEPFLTAMVLLNLAVPKKDLSLSIDDIVTTVKETIKNTKLDSNEDANLIDKATNFVSDLGSKAIDVISEGIKKLPGSVENTFSQLGDDFNNSQTAKKIGALKGSLVGGANTIVKEFNEAEINLTNSPTSVTVSIGNYFQHNEMVIENLDIKFSKQMTKTGPLFADFNLKLSSKKMPTYSEMGFKTFNSNTKRFIQ